ncbi:MurR/RpiR family transcriptional regulator [Enterococcus rivorum]|uniref:RpiR family transcriptional regulator n=1 Tax=Enterococcus rivorum TaxID=762845 RepID=A0A1E5KZ82_9ENTE|nr:MurR/RpiR family transcriptional regulator [Enterococcus rivorum]MBP2097535.1 DNA-binding MurR/RpiR family transcriptional regulator [Enterococcus rivorum]OEH82989.1 RpiR family transcriptional regulator [Enterococcus rivorum]
MNLIEQLTRIDFTYNEQLIINLILEHTERVLHMSIYELAKFTNSSTSTIVRLCKKTGVSGFKEFKIKLTRDLELYYQTINNIDVNMPFQARDSDLLISKKIAQLTQETINSTQSQLSNDVLTKSVDYLLKAQNIIAIGVSNSFIRLVDFQTKLLRINLYVRLTQLQPEQFYLATNATKKDVALIVSYSGNTAEIVNEAKIFKQNGTPIIAITSNPESLLASYASELLLIPNDEKAAFKVSTFSSQLAIEYVLNVLYSCIFNRNFDANYGSQKPTPISTLKF